MHLHRNHEELLIKIQVNDVLSVDIGVKEQFVAPVIHQPGRVACQPAKGNNNTLYLLNHLVYEGRGCSWTSVNGQSIPYI
jgi:hypothetical protein